MKYGLGIDTGGTYTDAVIYDFKNNSVVGTAKSITVKEDLTVGISGSIGQLPSDLLDQVALVSLSTTLATNACVEGKGSRAKLVMIGCDKVVLERYGDEYGLPAAQDIIFLDGGHDQHGESIGEPDWGLFRTAVMECIHEIDAFAIVELWGVRNSDYEKKAKEQIFNWTGLRAVCGHELTGEINSLKRAASAILNAQLIPIINDFLNAVKTSLTRKGIQAPLVIVRGDGSLMSEEFARGKPVETLLCGPAASVAGGIGLTGEKNCIIIDMGGTTSDIAIIKDGVPKLTTEDSNIGKWKTGIKSILINTVGLGGDSLIRRGSQGGLEIGPVRAAPLSWLAASWPKTLGTMRIIHTKNQKHTISLCEFFYLIRDISDDPFYNEEERRISDVLKAGPLSILQLAKEAKTSIYDMKTKRLEQYGVIMRCGLTPTDIMHLTGAFTGWEKDAAFFGASIMANQMDIALEDLIGMVNRNVKEKLYYHIVQMLLEDENGNLIRSHVSKQLDYLITSSFDRNAAAGDRFVLGRENDGFLHYAFSTKATLVGIGAPIHIYLPDVADALDTSYCIPANAAVANAIGAITGNVMVEESILIRPVYSPLGITGYIGFSSIGNQEFRNLDSAVEWATEKAPEIAGESAKARGASDFEVSVTVHTDRVEVASLHKSGTSEETDGPVAVGQPQDVKMAPGIAENPDETGSLFLETVVMARAIGKISLGS